MTEPRSLLILGAREGSIGDLVEQEAIASKRWSTITTAGPVNCDINLDMTVEAERSRLLQHRPFHDVVCTVGINYEAPIDERHPTVFEGMLRMNMLVNAVAPLAFLQQWANLWVHHPSPHPLGGVNFLCLSSNSAHIARSQSTAYCASKAALSMGLRTMARAMADWPVPINVVGYEFGWVNGTPMSQEVDKRMHDSKLPLHRIPGGRSLHARDAAQILVSELIDGLAYFKNGCTIRIDGGEQ